MGCRPYLPSGGTCGVSDRIHEEVESWRCTQTKEKKGVYHAQLDVRINLFLSHFDESDRGQIRPIFATFPLDRSSMTELVVARRSYPLHKEKPEPERFRTFLTYIQCFRTFSPPKKGRSTVILGPNFVFPTVRPHGGNGKRNM